MVLLWLVLCKDKSKYAPDIVSSGGGELEEERTTLVVEGVASQIEVAVEGDEVLAVADDRVAPAREQQHCGRRSTG